MDDASHKGGVPWNRAKLPPKRHECYVHTEGYVGTLLVARCACGGMRAGGRTGTWIEKNGRRNHVSHGVQYGVK